MEKIPTIKIRGFDGKQASIIQDVTLAEDISLEADTPVTLTGLAKICVRRKSQVTFLKLEIKPVIPVAGIEDTIFIDSSYVSFL